MTLHEENKNAQTPARELEASAWLDLFAAVPAGSRNELGLSSMKTENSASLACRAIPSVSFNRCFAIQPDWYKGNDEVDTTLQWLERNAAPGWVLQVDPDEFDETANELKRRRIARSGTGWAKLTKVVSGVGQQDTSIEILKVNNQERAQEFALTVQIGFGFPATTLPWFVALAQRENWYAYIAYLNGTPAAAATMFRRGQQAWFGVDTTLAAYRAQGLQGALVTRRLQDMRRGWAMAETRLPSPTYNPNDKSYRNYVKRGFDKAYESLNFAGPTSGRNSSTRPVQFGG